MKQKRKELKGLVRDLRGVKRDTAPGMMYYHDGADVFARPQGTFNALEKVGPLSEFVKPAESRSECTLYMGVKFDGRKEIIWPLGFAEDEEELTDAPDMIPSSDQGFDSHEG